MSEKIEKSIRGNRSSFDWYSQINDIISNIDLPNMPSILSNSIKGVVDFEHAAIFGYLEGRRPIFLFDGFSKDNKRPLVTPYLNGSYLVDPFYSACVDQIEPGLYRMRDIAPDNFYEEVGAHPGYVSPCISDEPGYLSEEIGFFAKTEQNSYIILSLMRAHDAPPFSSAEFAWLARIEPVVQAAVSHHWRDIGAGETNEFNSACLSNYVEKAFEAFGDEILTPREQEISRLILRGHSTGSMSSKLDISTATVKIHRKNLYSKLNISSQAELFSLFIDILSVAPSVNN